MAGHAGKAVVGSGLGESQKPFGHFLEVLAFQLGIQRRHVDDAKPAGIVGSCQAGVGEADAVLFRHAIAGVFPHDHPLASRQSGFDGVGSEVQRRAAQQRHVHQHAHAFGFEHGQAILLDHVIHKAQIGRRADVQHDMLGFRVQDGFNHLVELGRDDAEVVAGHIKEERLKRFYPADGGVADVQVQHQRALAGDVPEDLRQDAGDGAFSSPTFACARNVQAKFFFVFFSAQFITLLLSKTPGRAGCQG